MCGLPYAIIEAVVLYGEPYAIIEAVVCVCVCVCVVYPML